MRYRKPFLALLGDRFLIPISLLIDVQTRLKLLTGQVEASILFILCSFFQKKRNDYPLHYIWRKALLSMEEGTKLVCGKKLN